MGVLSIRGKVSGCKIALDPLRFTKGPVQPVLCEGVILPGKIL